MSSNAACVVLVKPGDVLLIGNVGTLADMETVGAAAARLRSALGLVQVAMFAEDIDVAAVTPSTSLAPASVSTTVLEVIDRAAIDKHRDALAQWLTANHVDPRTVVPEWLSIELAGEQRLIRYQVFRTTADGMKLTDPRDPDRAWTEDRTAPLLVDLNLPTSAQ